MCGIAGILDTGRSTPADQLSAWTRGMTDAIQHRGPDGEGVWVDAAAGIALSHRRLAVLDLTETGRQPMCSRSGRYVLTYNGEVYNHAELRADLHAAGESTWRGTSDTEIVLAAVEKWGLAAALPRFNGMFAMAVWDRQERELLLARDRMGKKPLYYAHVGAYVLFGSELKALEAAPMFVRELDRDALCLYLRYGYIPAPYSAYRHAKKLPQGTWASATSGPPVHYDPPQPPAMLHGDALDDLDAALIQAVKLRMVADVPIGALLSGGVDSSLVVALMREQSASVRTFTVAFDEVGFNEAAHARAVASHLGTSHTEIRLSPTEALAMLPSMVGVYDEPFADPSQLPTFLVSQLSRKSVTVCLSGDGGDEFFFGYNRYFRTMRHWTRLKRIPYGLRLGVARGLQRAVPRWIAAGNPRRSRAPLLGAATPMALYHGCISTCLDPEGWVVGGREPRQTAPEGLFPESMAHWDVATYLPDDVLVKVDRASMAVGLEVRAPLLDPMVVRIAQSLPLSVKTRAGQGKWPLRELLYRRVPRRLVDRPKQGFAVPLGSWLRGPLRDYGEGLLNTPAVEAAGVLDAPRVRAEWSSFQRVSHWPVDMVWNLIALQAWLNRS